MEFFCLLYSGYSATIILFSMEKLETSPLSCSMTDRRTVYNNVSNSLPVCIIIIIIIMVAYKR